MTLLAATAPSLAERIRAAVRALRPHQWSKNVLVFIPLLAAHRAGEPAVLLDAVLAFVSFCLCASAVYLFNDMLDLEADRLHTLKSRRPFACGDLSLSAGFVLVPLLLAPAGLIAIFLSHEFQFVLAAYCLVAVGYSL